MTAQYAVATVTTAGTTILNRSTKRKEGSTSDQRAIQLQQLANIVIDAYLNRNKRYKPDFGDGAGVIYLCRPNGDEDHPDLQVGHWYERADFEPEDRQ